MNEYLPEDYLQLSGLQHFLFCRRQWALIHLEDQWADNYRTVDGIIMHERAHSDSASEKRGNTIITRGMSIMSRKLGVSGKCDVLEFHRSEQGVYINGWEGRWLPYPVEYKRGEPKEGNWDAAQLCGQAMCLEEMLCCRIDEGSLYYGQTRHRLQVSFTEELRKQVADAIAEMHHLAQRGHTPKVKASKSCNACSLKELCMPAILKAKSIEVYLEENL